MSRFSQLTDSENPALVSLYSEILQLGFGSKEPISWLTFVAQNHCQYGARFHRGALEKMGVSSPFINTCSKVKNMSLNANS